MNDFSIDTVIHGDALEVLKTLPDECIDAIVCDPPAGISFMNKEFDHNKGGRTQWVAWLSEIMREARRCLRPGGHCLVWSLPRTSHWTALALEDAGFEIRDCLYQLVSGDTILLNFLNSLSEEQQHAFMQVLDAQREPSGITHIFGSGFPKSLSVDKAIDRHFNVERTEGMREWKGGQRSSGILGNNLGTQTLVKFDTPASEAAKQYSGFGSALKPACENWWLVRKPLAASSIAENVLQYGTGGLNIDGCRIQGGSIEHHEKPSSGSLGTNGIYGKTNELLNSKQVARLEGGENPRYDKNGRFPSHLLLTHTPSCIQLGTKRVLRGGGPPSEDKEFSDEHIANIYGKYTKRGGGQNYTDEDGMETVTAWQCPEFCPVRVLDEQGGLRPSGYRSNPSTKQDQHLNAVYGKYQDTYTVGERGYKDTGGPSRYFQQFPALDDIPPYIYAGKASRRDRNEGLEDLPDGQSFDKNTSKTIIRSNPDTGEIKHFEYHPSSNKNTHPTVKSQPLMRYLTRMICPPNGIVLDCFAGSGSTCVAAIHEGFHFVGIEREEEYVDIARKRIQHAMSDSGTQQPNIPLAHSVPPIARKTRNKIHSSQLTLFDMEVM